MAIIPILYVLTLSFVGSEFLKSDTGAKSSKLSISIEVEFKNQVENSETSVKFPITLKIANTQDTAVNFSAMTCSWEESFKTNDIRVYIEPHQCDSNIPERIKISPNSFVTYVGYIIFTKDYFTSERCSFKVGLRDIPFMDFVYPNFPSRTTSYPTYWSREIKVTKF